MVAEYSTKQPPPNPTSYTATDMLGSPRVITDSNGNVTSRRDFQPFGEELSPDEVKRTAALKYGSSDGIRQKFTSYQRDDETLLDFAEARMYENRHARFTAVDPLLASGKSANPQTFNRYVYVLNNPLAYTDPDGLQAATHVGKVWTDGTSFHRKQFENSYIYEGEPKYVDANDGFTYSVSSGGYYSIGTTAEILARAQRRSEADSQRREEAYAESMMPSKWVAELLLNPPGYDEVSQRSFSGGRDTLSVDGETTEEQLFATTDRQRAFAVAVGAVSSLGTLGGTGAPPSINAAPRGRLFTTDNGASFSQRLFLSENFGVTSSKFGNSTAMSQGAFNAPKSFFKAGWSSVDAPRTFLDNRKLVSPITGGGGMQFRLGIGRNPANPKQARFHFYIPRTFVPNDFANPSMDVKRSLFNSGNQRPMFPLNLPN